MSSFHDRIREKLAEPPRRSSADELPAEFHAVFLDFIEGLRAARPALQGEIERDGRQRTLVTYPKYRPDEADILLRIRWNGSTLRIAIGDDEDFDEIRSPEELRGRLLKLLDDPEYRKAIDRYEEVSEQEILALLYDDVSDFLTQRAVMLEVTPEAQKRIGEVKPGQEVTIHLRAVEDPRDLAGPYDPKRVYMWLKSGGYEVGVVEHRPEGDDIVLVIEGKGDDE